MAMLAVYLLPLVTGLCEGLLSPDTTVSPADSGLLHRIEILEQDNALLRHQVYDLLNNIQQLQTQYETLRDKEKSVGFLAYLGNTLVNPAKGSTVPFNEVVTNLGGGYDGNHGTFRVPMNGTYYFSVVGASPGESGDHVLHLFIVQNNKNLAYCFLDHSTTQWVTCNINTFVHLKEGDVVWVKVGDISGTHELGGHRLSDDADHSHFLGFLVSAD